MNELGAIMAILCARSGGARLPRRGADAVRCSAAVYVPGTHSVVHLPRLRRSAEVVDQLTNQLAPMPRRMGRTAHAPATLPARTYTYQKSMEPSPSKVRALSAQAAALRPVLAAERREHDAGLSQRPEKAVLSTNAGDETFGAAPGHFTAEL